MHGARGSMASPATTASLPAASFSPRAPGRRAGRLPSAAAHGAGRNPCSARTFWPSADRTRSTNAPASPAVGAVVERRDGVGGGHVLVLGDRDPFDLALRGVDVGDVDDAGVGLAERDLGHHALHGHLERDRLHGDAGLGERLPGVLAGGHLRRRQHDLESLSARSGSPPTPLGLPGSTAITSLLAGERLRRAGEPATLYMLASSAVASTSAGAPCCSCVTRSLLPANSNVTFTSGCNAVNWSPSW